MKRIVLIFFILFFIHQYSWSEVDSKNYEYEVFDAISNKKIPLYLTLKEDARLGKTFLWEAINLKLPNYTAVFITFLGIDSNNNIHFSRTKTTIPIESAKNPPRETSRDIVIKLIPKIPIYFHLLFTNVAVLITPINSSSIKIKLLPNEYIKEP